MISNATVHSIRYVSKIKLPRETNTPDTMESTGNAIEKIHHMPVQSVNIDECTGKESFSHRKTRMRESTDPSDSSGPLSSNGENYQTRRSSISMNSSNLPYNSDCVVNNMLYSA